MKITNELLLERLQHLENSNYAENTITNYFTDAKLFIWQIPLKFSFDYL